MSSMSSLKTTISGLVTLIICSSVLAQELPHGVIADSSKEWSESGVQPDGAWEYGYYQTGFDASTFTRAAAWINYYPGPDSWVGGGGRVWDAPAYPRIGKYSMAQSQDRKAVRRWTSPFTGRVIVQLDCQPIRSATAPQVFRLYRNGVLEYVFEKEIDTGTHHQIFINHCDVELGDQLDFVTDTGQWTHAAVRLVSRMPVSDALIYLPFDEVNDLPSGWSGDGPLYDRRSRVGDFSGNDNHGTLVGISGADVSYEGIHDRARYFDGVDDCVLLDRQDIGDGLQEITVSAWISPEGQMVASSGIVATRGTQDFVGIFPDATTGLIEFQTIIGGKTRIARAETQVPSGEWTHVAGVWKSGAIHKLYFNGKPVATNQAPVAGVLNVQRWHVGRLTNSFRGLIDEALVIPRALVDFQVRDLYHVRAPNLGITGSANYYDGVEDLAVLSPEENGSEEVTIAAWIAPFTKSSREAIVSSTGTDHFGLEFRGAGAQVPIAFIAKGSVLTGPNFSCPTGQWNHVTGVWKSGQICKLYINGQEVSSAGSVPTGLIDISQWVIGRGLYPTSDYHGFAEAPLIVSQAYTAAEVQALYEQTVPPGHSGPVELSGHLRWDYGFRFNHATVEELVATENFHLRGARGYHTGFLNASTTGLLRNSESASRLRGYLTAPETGEYYFWVSSRTAVDLSLSPDDQKYTKQRIARLSPTDGTATGVSVEWPNLWDNFVSQMSEPILLEAGERYYLDVLQTTGGLGGGHIAIAWARPSGDREMIPSEFLSPYVIESEDQEDDFLPDAWEIQYGLNIADNGAINISQEGEYGDYDADGLTNLEEYLLGTDPTMVDSDGDGISDLDENRVYHTDPTISDATPESIVDTIDLQTESDPSTDWVGTGSGGLLATSFRGTGTWSFNVPTSGHYVVQMSAQMRGDLRFEEALPVIVAIDGRKVGRSVITFRGEVPGTLRLLTPWMPVGQHEFSIFIDNNTTRRSLEVSSIQILTPGGNDLDGNGLADWADQQLAERSKLWANEQYSHISPAFIEGLSPSESLVDLTTITRSGQTNRETRFTISQWENMLVPFAARVDRFAERLQPSMRQRQINPTWYNDEGRMEGTAQSHAVGPGTTRWLSSLDLHPNEAIGYVSQFDNLGTYGTGTIAWVPVNLLDTTTSNLTIPIGSKLLFGAWIGDWDNKNVTVTVDGQTLSFKARKTKIHHFTTAGTYLITATHQNGTTGTLTVDVKDATLPSHLAVGEQRFFDTSLPTVTPDLLLDINEEVPHNGLTAATTGSTSRIGGLIPGRDLTAARLSGNAVHPGGRGTILNQTETYVVGVSDALRNGSDTVSPLDGDFFLVSSPLLVMHLPPGATIEANIFAGGVTFPDGTTTRTLTEADLDDNGIYTFEFHIPRERLGAPCHYINIYNNGGDLIWNSTN